MKPSRSELLTLAMVLCEKDENEGICHSCGETQGNVEPDASKYKCDSCGEFAVYGAEETVLLLS
jgi:hypothetical protein